jgi:hypothetical protein
MLFVNCAKTNVLVMGEPITLNMIIETLNNWKHPGTLVSATSRSLWVLVTWCAYRTVSQQHPPASAAPAMITCAARAIA